MAAWRSSRGSYRGQGEVDAAEKRIVVCPYVTCSSTPQQVVPMGTELHHISIQQVLGVRGGKATTSISCDRHPHPPVASLARHRSLRGPTPVSAAQPSPLSSHHPTSRTAPNRSPRRNDDLRNGTARRISPSLPPHLPLRRLGPGRSRSLDRRPQASLSISEDQHVERTGREAAPAPPCSRMTSPSNGCSGYAASTRTSTAPGSACAICAVASVTAASRSLASLLKARPT